MSRRSQFPQRVRAREAVVGPWLSIPHPAVVETLAQTGADFLLIDGEHAPITPQALPALLPSAEQQDAPVIYRVAWNRIELIKAALDSGASGLMVPMINSAAEAAEAIAAAKYPPMGKRGMGAWRASNYYQDNGAYVDRANADTLMVLQIETREAIRDIEAIAAVPGIDVLFIGPADLSRSLGLASGAPQAELLDAYRKVVAATQRNGIIAGIDVVSPDYAKTYRELGFSFMTSGSDFGYVLDAGRAYMQKFRAAIAKG